MITTSDDICKNCNQDIVQNFCSNCGQKRYKRIDRKYIWEEIQYTTIHTNKGFLYSLRNILRNPGKTARPFIDGQRINHYKPIGLVFILSAIGAFISYKIIGLNEIMKQNTANPQQGSQMMDDYMSFVSHNTPLIMIALVPFLALFSKIAFRKSGHNYYEHIIMNAYGLSFYTAVSIIFLYPFYFIFKDNAPLIMQISMYSFLTIPVMMVWFYKNFYPEKSLKSIIPRVGLITVLFGVFYIILIIVLIVVIVVKMGPDAMQYIQPKIQPR